MGTMADDDRTLADYARLRRRALGLSREGMGQAEIARKLGVNVRTVRRWARRDGWRDRDLAAQATPDPLARAQELRASAMEAAQEGELELARKTLAQAARLDKLARDLDGLRARVAIRLPEDMSDAECAAALRALLAED